MLKPLYAALLPLLLTSACFSAGADPSGGDGGSSDLLDAGEHDSADSRTDTDISNDADGGTQSGVDDDTDGFDAGETAGQLPWTISGACGVLDDELVADSPSLHKNAIDFGSDLDEDTLGDALSAGGSEILNDDNAGGSSIWSEVIAFEVLHGCETAELIKTETEIVYDTQSKLTDFLVEIDDVRVGVSVTRAVAYPFDSYYPTSSATELLDKKLGDIQLSSAAVSTEDAWNKQILVVIAYASQHSEAIEEAWEQLDDEVKADTVVMVTTSEGDDAFIF